MLTTLTAQIVRFARPNIQIYDAHVVDLYQWVGARYLVGVKGADTTAKRDFNSALDRISERIALTSNPKVRPGGQLSKSTLYISIGYGGDGVSQSPLKDKVFSTFPDQNPPFELPSENGISPSTKASPAQWLAIDNSAIKRLAKGKLPSHRSA